MKDTLENTSAVFGSWDKIMSEGEWLIIQIRLVKKNSVLRKGFMLNKEVEEKETKE